MRRILVPYHLDEHLPDLDVPLSADVTVTADLPEGTPWQRMAALGERVAAEVRDTVADGSTPLVLAGDCVTALGTVAGLQRAGMEPGIVWFDAHGDVQTLETTASGYLGGLPLRLLVGYRPDLLAAPLALRPVPEDQVVLVDARDLDPPEAEYLEQAVIRRCEVADLAGIGLPDRPLYVHLDADVVDAGDVPGLRFPAAGGPGLHDLAGALRHLSGNARIAALGVACTWHPGHGAADRFRTALTAVSP